MKNRYLICKRCGGGYKLKEGEAPEDFEKCQCGGELHCETYNEQPDQTIVQPEIAGKKNHKTEKAGNPNSRLKNIKNIIMETGGSETPKTEENAIQTGKNSIKKILPKQTKRFIPYDMVFTFLFACLCFLSLSFFNHRHIGETLGVILIVFFPGYVITAILYPKRDGINIWERLGLSVMLSLFIILIFVIVNHYSSITNARFIFIIISIMTMTLALTAILSLLRVKREERFYGYLAESWGKLKGSVKGRRKMSFLLVILLLLSVVTLVYLIANPHPGESFTEFYILGPQGKVADYPTNVAAGQQQTVIMGMVNHEHRETNYQMVVQSNGAILTRQDITLSENQKVEIPYSFTMQKSGEVEFLLYKLPDTNVYLSLHLWVNVT